MPDPIWAPDEAAWRRAAELVEWSTPFDAVWQPRNGADSLTTREFPASEKNLYISALATHHCLLQDVPVSTVSACDSRRRLLGRPYMDCLPQSLDRPHMDET